MQLRSAVTSAGRAWALVGMTSMSLPRCLYLMNFPIVCIEPTIGLPGLSGLACFIASLACRCCHQGSTSPSVGYLSPCSTSVAFNTFNSVQLRQHGAGLVPPRTVPVPPVHLGRVHKRSSFFLVLDPAAPWAAYWQPTVLGHRLWFAGMHAAATVCSTPPRQCVQPRLQLAHVAPHHHQALLYRGNLGHELTVLQRRAGEVRIVGDHDLR